MITFEDARAIAIEKIGPHNGLVDEFTVAKPFGWYFQYASNSWLRTRDDRDAYLGGCSFVVDRETGDVYEFGSLGNTETKLAAYGCGLRYEPMDLTIRQIHNLKKTLDYLTDVVNYVVPDPVDLWHRERNNLGPRPLKHSREKISDALWNLPCTFHECEGLFYKYEQFVEIDRSRCFEYELRICKED